MLFFRDTGIHREIYSTRNFIYQTTVTLARVLPGQQCPVLHTETIKTPIEKEETE